MSALIVDTSVWVSFFRGQSLARLEQALSDGDVVLAPIDESQWTEVRSQAYPASDDDEYPFTIRVLERR